MSGNFRLNFEEMMCYAQQAIRWQGMVLAWWDLSNSSHGEHVSQTQAETPVLLRGLRIWSVSVWFEVGLSEM